MAKQEQEGKSEKSKYQPIGSGHASAMARMGLGELRAAMYPESNVAQQPEYGIYGTRTPGEVAADRREDVREVEHEPAPREGSVLAKKQREADSRDERANEDKARDR